MILTFNYIEIKIIILFSLFFFLVSCIKISDQDEIKKFIGLYEQVLNDSNDIEVKKLFQSDVKINFFKYIKQDNKYEGLATLDINQFLKFNKEEKKKFDYSSYKIVNIEIENQDSCKKLVFLDSLSEYIKDSSKTTYITKESLCVEYSGNKLIITRADYVLLKSSIKSMRRTGIK